MMDVIQLLTDDHNQVKSLFEQALQGRAADEAVVTKICEMLIIHTQLEEQFVYPEAEKMNEAKDLVSESYREHAQAKQLIRKLEKNKTNESEHRDLIEQLQSAIEHHVREEESELFPILRRNLSDKQLNELGKVVHQHKEMLQKEFAAG